MNGFESQVGEVRVFPQHFQVMDGSDKTQLRWRFYESSGDISYETSGVDRNNEQCTLANLGKIDQGEKNMVTDALRHNVEDLLSRFEIVERLALSYRDISSHVLERMGESMQTYERLCSLLREKIATMVQKPLNPYRRNCGSDASDIIFDLSCARSMKVCVDCSIDEFETACCAIRAITTRAYFRADGRDFVPTSGCLHASVAVAEILFDSLRGLCQSIVITQDDDIFNIARQQKRLGNNNRSEYAAVRFAGSFLVDTANAESPCAVLVSRSIHDGVSQKEFVHVVTRDSRDLDPRTLWYKQPFRADKMTIYSLLRHLYRDLPCFSSNRVNGECDVSVTKDTGCFALRWKPLPNANPKLWTRAMVMRSDYAGSLEVEIPYVLIRRSRGNREINEIVTDTFMKEVLS